jgi:hypothetical protein
VGKQARLLLLCIGWAVLGRPIHVEARAEENCYSEGQGRKKQDDPEPRHEVFFAGLSYAI